MYKNLSGINQPKRVDVFDENNKYLISFSSMRECAREMKIPSTTLHKAIKGNYSIKNKFYKYGN